MKRAKYRMLLLVTLVPFLSACFPPREWSSQADPTKKDINPAALALYPRAEQVRRETLSTGRATLLVTYSAPASEADVQDFYKSSLEQDGWTLNEDISTPSELNFTWVNGTSKPAYTLKLTTEQTTNGQTRVLLKIITYGPQ